MKTYIAHRGLWLNKNLRDNTLPAFQEAIKVKADYIEFDLRRTKDKKIVVFHDAKYKNKYIRNYTFKELNKRAQKEGFYVPLFREVLELAKGKVKCDIELKEKGYEKQILKETKTYLSQKDFVFTSFCEEALAKLKALDPNVKTGLIIGADVEKGVVKTRIREIFPSRNLKKAKADFLVAHYYFVDFLCITRFYPKYKIWVWGTNNPKKIKKYLKNKKIDAIITDINFKAII